ncbi:MAG: hypothetical protein LUQ31_06325 [Methanoregula sp.]|nr:hypothetical protein [Methanoregula sp.]
MSELAKSPLGMLVLFMVCLSIVGTFIAGVHYYAVDLPHQQQVQAPTNQECWMTNAQCVYIHSQAMCCYQDCCNSVADLTPD